jgi:RNA 2',3'-cyclic 3'-phosphodiesterase
MTDVPIRLFFALWPDESTRAAIAACARTVVAQTGGREVVAKNLHLTLAFLGERPRSIVRELRASAARIPVTPMHLRLDDVGCWRKTGIAWLAMSALCPELPALHERLLTALAPLGIAIDEGRFVPHITLARRIVSRVALLLPKPIVWEAKSFALVASELGDAGARYHVLDTWPGEAQPPRATGRAGSDDHSLHDPGYRREP